MTRKNIVKRALAAPTHPRTHQVDPELAPLALAWLRGEITVTQASYAMDRPVRAFSGSLYRMMRALRQEVLAGRIEIS